MTLLIECRLKCVPTLIDNADIDVPAVNLDDFVANGAPAPQLVKIDVEGGEYDVLRGGDAPFLYATSAHRR